VEIENIVKFMKSCKFDESNRQYSDAYYHIAHTTHVYIALSLKIDSEKVNFNNYIIYIKYLPIITNKLILNS